MTWKEFKDKVESLGIKDDSLINYIDINSEFKFGAIQDASGEWSID